MSVSGSAADAARATVPEHHDAPCNICGRGWPYHNDACTYKAIGRERLKAEARVRELESALDGLTCAAKGVRHARKTYMGVAQAEVYYERLFAALAEVEALAAGGRSPVGADGEQEA